MNKTKISHNTNSGPGTVLRAAFCVFLFGCAAHHGGGADNDAAIAGARASVEWERAALLAASLDDRLLAAQVIISGIDGRGTLSAGMRILLEECPAGGIILFRYNLDTETGAIQNLIAESAALIAPAGGAGIRPFVAVDHEGGAVNRFRPGVAPLPPAGSYWEGERETGRRAVLARVEADSFHAGSVLKGMGINLNLAPVAEYLTADNREFLGGRSYGPDPFFTAEAAAAFVRGMERAGLLCGVKHFPGSAGPDPHRFPSLLRFGRPALDELAAPFAALIRDGRARALMISHSMVPALDAEHIASLSAPVMNGWLRGELGFGGIIISDDFSMSAASSPAAPGRSPVDAAVQSLSAGADMVLVWPPDIRRTHRAIMSALDRGALSRERLREAAARIIFEKFRMGLIDDQ
jgi:beta-N-acetylhexosaminidase